MRATGIESGAMIRPDYRGAAARRAILTTLRQRERAGLRTSYYDLSGILDAPVSSLQWHVRTLRTAGLLNTRRYGRQGAITLTDAGRLAADTLPDS